MRVGTKSILFGVHHFLIHPFFVLYAWWILYEEKPTAAQLMAILTHDLGYWGSPNMDGVEGEAHPQIAADWWFSRGTPFGRKVALEILGHSGFHARANGLELSKLYYPDKLATSLYPPWLYLLLGNLSGEIHEYMEHTHSGKYKDTGLINCSQHKWLLDVQAKVTSAVLRGKNVQDNEAELIEELLKDEGSTVTLHSRNAGFDGTNDLITVSGDYTGWVDKQFTGLHKEIK